MYNYNNNLNNNSMMSNWNQSWNRSSNYNNMMAPAPHYEIIEVNGEAGARAFRMGPNSSQFLADLTNPHLIWCAQTDGAGYLTLTPMDVDFHKTQESIDINSLETRLKALEDTVNEYVNSGPIKQPKKQQQQQQHTNSNNNSST